MKCTLLNTTVTLLFLLLLCGAKENFQTKVGESKDNSTEEDTDYLAEPKDLIKQFKQFKQRYKKHYSPEEKQHKFENFANNYKKIKKLNKNSTINTPENIQYALNRYSDLSSAESQDHYAIRLPYDEVQRSGDLRGGDPKLIQSINETPLYDLYNAGKLYEDFKKKMKFTYAEDEKDEDLIHYYRFIKTLVEINRNNAQREGPVRTIDYDADDIKEPEKAFWIL